MAARTLNLMLALWLFFSAFVWQRTAPSMANAWILGIVVSAVSVASMLRKVWLRYVNTALSAWLLASAFLLPQRSSLAVWNDVAVALAMLAVSLVPGSLYARTELRRRQPAAAEA
ncbi:SPW repeat domain-containing protein [Anaeromyxobacter oryzae]|uniref:SPW repeat-containing integral membrane domain-containing protein n=1 Tax=Anaeromyxobacter oryzae TaxID=2918170 RepID=A0ABM7X4Y1_9BACT|nr:hypothetical protein [Anaeromyxobacter oryzae]BDG06879.1 hypothetical protein AMOR_58750 [Anaeromyxobacter oryzae]